MHQNARQSRIGLTITTSERQLEKPPVAQPNPGGALDLREEKIGFVSEKNQFLDACAGFQRPILDGALSPFADRGAGLLEVALTKRRH